MQEKSLVLQTIEKNHHGVYGVVLLKLDGMLRSWCVLFPIMGGSLADVRSPQFLLSAGIHLAIMLVSCAVFYLRQKEKTHKQ